MLQQQINQVSQVLDSKLSALNPMAILERGYSIVMKDNKIIKPSIINGATFGRFRNLASKGLTIINKSEITNPYINNLFSDLTSKNFIFPYSFFTLKSETNLVMLN